MLKLHRKMKCEKNLLFNYILCVILVTNIFTYFLSINLKPRAVHKTQRSNAVTVPESDPCTDTLNLSASQPDSNFLCAVLLVRVYKEDKARLTMAHVLQWIRYMRYAGVDRFYVYDAYEKPGESLRYDLGDLQNVMYIDWSKYTPYEMVKTQVSAYQHAVDTHRQCQWQAALDIDEYPFLASGDQAPGFLARYIQRHAREDTGEISLSNYLLIGQTVFDERLWLAERYKRLTVNPGNNLVKPIYRPSAIAHAALHHNAINLGEFHVMEARHDEMIMVHVWGGRIMDFLEGVVLTQDLMEKTKDFNELFDLVQIIKIWNHDFKK